MKIIGRFNPITKSIDSVSSFLATMCLCAVILSFGMGNTGDFTNKVGKLFTVAEPEEIDAM